MLFPSSKLSSLKAQIDEEDVKSIFVGATKYEILHYLEDAKERGVDALQDDAENVRISVWPKRLNTEITETEISVRFIEPESIIPNRNSQYFRFLNELVLSPKNLGFFKKHYKIGPKRPK